MERVLKATINTAAIKGLLKIRRTILTDVAVTDLKTMVCLVDDRLPDYVRFQYTLEAKPGANGTCQREQLTVNPANSAHFSGAFFVLLLAKLYISLLRIHNKNNY